MAQRVFLTLCNWRSTVPLVALEAVLLRPENEKMAVSDAVEELERSSFVELIASDTDQQAFLSIPLVAAVFGKRKLAVSPLKAAVQADTEILHQFGAGQLTDIRHGVAPRIERLIKSVARKVTQEGAAALDTYTPMLEFITRSYPPAWLLVSELYEELGEADGMTRSKDAVRRYLELAPKDQANQAWARLVELCRRSGDVLGEVHAFVEMCEISNTPYPEISNAANRFNSLLADRRDAFDLEEEKILVRRLIMVLESRIIEADATDCSRLAWLYAHINDNAAARRSAKRGLEIEPTNEYCLKLVRGR